MGPVIKLNPNISLYVRFYSPATFSEFVKNSSPTDLKTLNDIKKLIINTTHAEELKVIQIPEIKIKLLENIIQKITYQVSVKLFLEKYIKKHSSKQLDRNITKSIQEDNHKLVSFILSTEINESENTIKPGNIQEGIIIDKDNLSEEMDVLSDKNNKNIGRKITSLIQNDLFKSKHIDKTRKVSYPGTIKEKHTFHNPLYFFNIPLNEKDLEALKRLREIIPGNIILKYKTEIGGADYFDFYSGLNNLNISKNESQQKNYSWYQSIYKLDSDELHLTENNRNKNTRANSSHLKSFSLKTTKLAEFLKLTYCLEHNLINGALIEIAPPVSCEDIYNYIRNIKLGFSAIGFGRVSYRVISCPMCGRCTMDIEELALRVEDYMNKLDRKLRRKGINLEEYGGLKVAVMGCNVNGPGEAKAADIGVAGGKNKTATIFTRGKPLKTISEDKIEKELEKKIKKILEEIEDHKK